ncbi:MAG: hypothetical protein K9L30_13090 [Desulfobacterales bacterium]|nr:hypothetical protein [Desulfobacterales bacterium]
MFGPNGNPSGEAFTCHLCGHNFERPDMVAVEIEETNKAIVHICSLCLSTNKTGNFVLPAGAMSN